MVSSAPSPSRSQSPPLETTGTRAIKSLPRTRLPPRNSHVHPHLQTLWKAFDGASQKQKRAYRIVYDLVLEQEYRESGPSRPRMKRIEADVVAALWVEGPQSTAAMCDYIRATNQMQKIESLIIYLDKRLSDSTTQFFIPLSRVPSPPTPDDRVPRGSSPPVATRTSTRIQERSKKRSNTDSDGTPEPSVSPSPEVDGDEDDEDESQQRRSKRIKFQAAFNVKEANKTPTPAHFAHLRSRKSTGPPGPSGKENRRRGRTRG